MAAKNPFDMLVKQDHSKPPRITFLGAGGVGKTTIACSAPSPIVIQTEDGLSGLDVPAFDLCQSFDDVLRYVRMLHTEQHPYKTLVIDSADWLDILIDRAVAEEEGVAASADIGYAKGGPRMAAKWRTLFEQLNRLRNKGMIVVFTAHSILRTVHDPRFGSFDRLTLKMNKETGPLLEEWCDAVFYCDYELHAKKEGEAFGKKKVNLKAVGGRIMYTAGSPAMTAKNRWGLPEVLPLEWRAFSDAYKAIKKAKQQTPEKPEAEPEA